MHTVEFNYYSKYSSVLVNGMYVSEFMPNVSAKTKLFAISNFLKLYMSFSISKPTGIKFVRRNLIVR